MSTFAEHNPRCTPTSSPSATQLPYFLLQTLHSLKQQLLPSALIPVATITSLTSMECCVSSSQTMVTELAAGSASYSPYRDHWHYPSGVAEPTFAPDDLVSASSNVGVSASVISTAGSAETRLAQQTSNLAGIVGVATIGWIGG